jgi:mannose-1-phosphate guanylyltransferase
LKAFLLAAGRGKRFAPVSEKIPKPLFPFLNVPILRAHLARLRRLGVSEAGVNLHHLGDQIERHLREDARELPKVRFYWEPRILGTAGALRNAGRWLAGDDFLVVNADAAIEFDAAALFAAHRDSGRAATLLVIDNHEPDRYTPLQSEGDRVTGFGGVGPAPLLYTGVCALSPRLLPRIPPGEASLVSDLWLPLLAEGREEIGLVRHVGPFADLGRPRDFLRASLEALSGARPLPIGAGDFDPASEVLAAGVFAGVFARSSVLGRGRIGDGARIVESVVWDGAEIGTGASLRGCLAAGGVVPSGTHSEDALLWAGHGEPVSELPLDGGAR